MLNGEAGFKIEIMAIPFGYCKAGALLLAMTLGGAYAKQPRYRFDRLRTTGDAL